MRSTQPRDRSRSAAALFGGLSASRVSGGLDLCERADLERGKRGRVPHQHTPAHACSTTSWASVARLINARAEPGDIIALT